jgi:hypothetical protein
MSGSFFLNAGVLFKTAVTAYERTKTAPSDTAGGQNDALVAILFSAATLEALIMEVALLAEISTGPPASDRIIALAGILDEAEKSRGSPKLKYLIAKAILSGKPYNKGEAPYQDFSTLFSLRDSIIHLKPEGIAKPPAVLEQLRSSGVCAPQKPNETESWLDQISTRAAARWACNVVASMVASLKEALGADAEKMPVAGFFFGSRFERVQ